MYMKTIELVNFYQFLMSLSQRQFKGKLSYAIYKNLNKIESIAIQYFKDVEALAKSFNIQEVDGKFNFEGDSYLEFEKILNDNNEVELHKVDIETIFDYDFSATEISMLEYMIEKKD